MRESFYAFPSGGEIKNIEVNVTDLQKLALTCLTVIASENKYSLDLSQAFNFIIETTDTNDKTIEFINLPSVDNLVRTIVIYLKYTNAITNLNFPSSVKWEFDNAPSFSVGSNYLLTFTTFDKDGTRFIASCSGAYTP